LFLGAIWAHWMPLVHAHLHGLSSRAYFERLFEFPLSKPVLVRSANDGGFVSSTIVSKLPV
jgi:hypothetical protein